MWIMMVSFKIKIFPVESTNGRCFYNMLAQSRLFKNGLPMVKVICSILCVELFVLVNFSLVFIELCMAFFSLFDESKSLKVSKNFTLFSSFVFI